MKHYAVYEYAYDSIKEEFTDLKGQIKAFIDADDPFDACEKTGMKDPIRYFAEPIYTENLKKIKEDIEKEKELLGKLSASIDSWIGDAKEQATICPNCGKKLNDKAECPACGFGVDEVSIDGQVVTKEMFDKFEKEMKKAAKKKKKPAAKK